MTTPDKTAGRSPTKLLRDDEHQFEITVRELLRIFGYERRGKHTVIEVQEALNTQGLIAIPQFDQCDIDWEISISKTLKGSKLPLDPFTRIKSFLKHDRRLLSVKREDTIERAITLMLQNDYSQLPVLKSERQIEGVICWRTIGQKMSLFKDKPSFVHQAMEEAVVVEDNEHLDNVIVKVLSREYVLVRESKGKEIKWILTQEDIGQSYKEISEGYLTVKDIESFIRSIIQQHCSLADLNRIIGSRRPNPAIARVDDLYFSDYVHLLSTDEIWKKTALPVDKNEFNKILSDLIEVRNSIMHFRAPTNEIENFDSLRKMRRLIMSLEFYTELN